MSSARRLPSTVYRLPVLALLLVTMACATSYKPRGFFGDGYSEQRLRPDVWLVAFDASAFTPPERVQTYTLWRCAELTLDEHANYFAVVTGGPFRRTSTKPRLIDRPPYAETERGSEPNYGAARSERLTIQLYKERPEGIERFYEARALIQDLAPKMREK